MHRALWLIPLALCMDGCGDTPPPEVTPALMTVAQRQWPGITAEQLQRGRQTLMIRCTECHGLRQPVDHLPREWAAYLLEMGPKARLDERDTTELTRYLLAAREQALAAAAATAR